MVWKAAYENEGVQITEDMIKDQLEKMKVDYKLPELGFEAKYQYTLRQQAYEYADHLAKLKAARLAIEAGEGVAGRVGRELAEHADDLSREADDIAKGASRGGRVYKVLGKIPLMGIAIGVFFGIAAGDQDALVNAIEPIGFGPTTMGDAEIHLGDPDEDAYSTWDRYQMELTRQAAEKLKAGKY
jgi:hypothetical protein